MSMLFTLHFIGGAKDSEKDAEASMTTLQAFVFFEKYKVSNIDSVPQCQKKGIYM